LYASVQVTFATFDCPPNAKAAFEEAPAPAKLSLAVIIAPPVDQVDPLYASVQAHNATFLPPNAKDEFWVPAPANCLLAVIIAPPVDQVDPLYASVQLTTATLEFPPNAKAEFEEAPAPAKSLLAVIIAPPADQVDPLYASVQANPPIPPNAKAAVEVPVPANWYLAVIIAPPADQDVPLYASVQAHAAASTPPNAKAAVEVPAPAKLYLATDIAPPADQAVILLPILSVATNNTLGLPCSNEPVVTKEKVLDNVLSLADTNDPELINAIRLNYFIKST
jgi:hypothetical protein